MVLRHQGHRILEAPDGDAGLAMALAEHPDLVITDILMPGMDGYELFRQLRRNAVTKAIPVVLYTAHYGQREAREFALTSGVADVLTKPARSSEILRVVGRVLSPTPHEPAAEDSPPLATAFTREQLRLAALERSENAIELRALNARLQALVNVGLELSSERNPAVLLQSVCASSCDLFGATYVTLGFIDRDDLTVRHFGTSDLEAPVWIGAGDAVPGILGTAVVEQRAIRGENAGGEPAGLNLPALHPEVRSFMVAPITSAAYTYGWIFLAGNEGRRFNESDEQMLTALAGLLGRIYENGHFYALAQERAAQLEHEILERTKVETSLRTAEENMRFTLESAKVGIWDHDHIAGVLHWSELLEGLYGFSPGTFGGSFEDFIARVHPDDRDELRRTVAAARRAGGDFSINHRALWPDGTVRFINGAGRVFLSPDGQPVRSVGISMDVSARHHLEEQYLQSQKMEVIGQLASGVAHDFNNLLTVILGNCELLLSDTMLGASHRADVFEIQKAGGRAAGLTRQLLAFSRKQIIQPALLDLNDVVRGMRPMLGRLIGEDVNIVMDLGPSLARVKADAGQVEQVVMNLAVNARDAMAKGGTLTIGTANVEGAESPTRSDDVSSGSHVALTVTDTGSGMTPDVLSRLFEPFFTTKPPGKGTGLGLATVHDIVSRSGGSVSVVSREGSGSTFTACFPKTADLEEAAPARSLPPSARRGVETVLVVEDTAALRELTRRLLERLGYAVLVASDAEDALAVCDQEALIAVLLTDVVLPGASGPDLAARLLERWPDLKVVYMSGYTEPEGALVRHGTLETGVAFLPKPFTAEALGSKIREALGSEHSSGA